jgi:four helix bundle protein
MKMQDYRKLRIWNDAMKYVEDIYRFTTTVSREERYGLTEQLKRAGLSIPLNIAEGAGCNTDGDFTRFLWYAYRSVNEVATCLELANRLKVTSARAVQTNHLIDRGDKLNAMLFKFIQTLNGKRKTGHG